MVIDLRDGRRPSTYLRSFEPQVTPQHRGAAVLRRIVDITLALFGLMLAMPVMLVIIVANGIFDSGPLFYAQERVGRNGRVFKCLKFRSMRVDADERLQNLLATDPAFRSEWLCGQKVANDPRTTPLGRLLRKTSVDELPQLLNVIRGDMALVGPRPVVVPETIRYGAVLPTVLSVRPGLTGLWQVSGRNNLTYEERIDLDLEYVRTQSPRLDLLILVKTVRCVVTGYGAC